MHKSAITGWRNSRTILLPALAILLGTTSAAFSGSFDIPPRRYDSLANRALIQVGSELRFSFQGCGKGEIIECRFSAQHVTARITGRAQPPHIEKILIEADLFQDKAGADPVTVVTNVVLAFGATVTVIDPRLPAERRVQLLSDLTNTALASGQSEATGVDAKYAVSFDEAAGGLIAITVLPVE